MIFIDLFSGIGGFRQALDELGHTCVAFCDIDDKARQSYKAIYDTTGEDEYTDITKVGDETWQKYKGKVDIITAGFPCQAFSMAGDRAGFDNEDSGKLIFEVIRAAKQIKPKYLLLENVRGILSHNKGETFTRILEALQSIGYFVEFEVTCASHFVPQHRERVFITCTRVDLLYDATHTEKILTGYLFQKVLSNASAVEKLQYTHTKDWIVLYLLLKDLLKDKRMQTIKNRITQTDLLGEERQSYTDQNTDSLYKHLSDCIYQVSLFDESIYTNIRLQGLIANSVLNTRITNPKLYQSISQKLIIKKDKNYERYPMHEHQNTSIPVSMSNNLSAPSLHRATQQFIIRHQGEKRK
jgi:DNA-cytosine methyltransferase